MTDPNLRPTELLDFDHPSIARLLTERGWHRLPLDERVGAAYAFVRDEIRFGYNVGDVIPASRVLEDGYGQCNTKATLLISLLRGLDVPSRLHGATIHKRLQKGVVDGLFYALAPTSIIHSWPEALVGSRWVALEGVILDRPYLAGLRAFLAQQGGALIGYGVGTDDLASPPIDWCGDDTAIQMTGVNQDFGTFADPDAFYAAYGSNLSGVRGWLFRHWIRHTMNRRVASIRAVSAAASRAGARPALQSSRASSR